MDPREFRVSLTQKTVPVHFNEYLKSLWYDGKGRWERAHEIAQDLNDKDAAWIHAYLHRKEGDLWNARYWYSRAGRELFNGPLPEEWEMLVDYFLKKVY